MKRTITYFAALIILAACTGTGSEVTGVLERADSIMESCPDSAYTLLDDMDNATVSSLTRAESARYYLLLGTAMNKTDRPMAFDSLFEHTVVDYYDRHGTSNEQMRARYIMGCICRDMHESPRAIEWYLSATGRADTLASDCDNLTLMRIYGQMAYVYIRQMMPEKTIESNRQYSKYAAKCGNTYEYIRGIELQLDAYNTLGDSQMIFALTDSVRHLYLQNNMSQAAARVYPTAIIAHLNLQNYAKARHMMDIFENESGLFDTDGNIQNKYASYYTVKGLYYNGVGQLDSAEYYYRKTLSHGFSLSGSRGLFNIYLSRNVIDSIELYGQAYEHSLAEFERNTNIQAMHNISSLYDYSRHKQKAQESELKAQKTKYWLIIVSILSTVVIIVLIRKWQRQNLKRKKSVERLCHKLCELQEALESRKKEIEELDKDRIKYELKRQMEVEALQQLLSDTECMLQAKTSEASELAFDIRQFRGRSTAEIREMSARVEHANQILIGIRFYEDDMPVKEDAIYKKLLAKSNNPSALTISQAEWNTFVDVCDRHFPRLRKKMSCCELTAYQVQVTYLVRLGFSNGDIARLIDKNRQNIRSFKASANKKLFGVFSAGLLYDNLMRFNGYEM